MSILLLSQFLHDTNYKNNLGRPVALGASGAPSGLFYESLEMARAARDGSHQRIIKSMEWMKFGDLGLLTQGIYYTPIYLLFTRG